MQAVKHALGLDHSKTADNTTGHSTTGQTHSGPADTTHNPNDTTHTSLSDATGTTNSHNIKTDSNKHTLTSDYGFGNESHTGEVLNRDTNNGGLADRAAQATGMGGAGHHGLTSGSGVTGDHHSHGTGAAAPLTGAGATSGLTGSSHSHSQTTTGTGSGLTGDHSSHSHNTGTGAGLTGAAASAASGLTGNHSHSHTGTATGTGLTGSTTNTGAGYDRDTASSGVMGSSHSHTHDENCSHGHPVGTAGHGRIAQAMDKVKGEWEGFHTADGRRFECDALDASQLANRNTGGQQSGLERV